MPQISLLHVTDGKIRTDLKCTACNLCDNSKAKSNCLQGTGPSDASIMVVGYHPGKEDDANGQPYSGPSGAEFHTLLREVGFNPAELFFTNCLRCFPPHGTKIKKTHFAKCQGHLIQEINRVKPKAIISVGAHPLEWLTGIQGVRSVSKRGLPCALDSDLLVYPLQQPAALYYAEGAHRSRLRREMVDDLKWLYGRLVEGKVSASEEIETDYQMATTLEDVQRFLTELDAYDELSLDFETTSLFPRTGDVVVAAGFSGKPGHARVIPVYAWGINTLHFWEEDEVDNNVVPWLTKFLNNHKFYGHNLIQFDACKWSKFQFGTDRLDVTFDTMLAHYLTNETKGTHSLEQLAITFLKVPPWKDTFDIKNILRLTDYLCRDVDYVARLKPILTRLLTAKQKTLLKEVVLPLAHVLGEMEYRGVKASKDGFEALEEELEGEIGREKAEMRSLPEIQSFELKRNTEVNLNSPQQIADLMENYFNYPCFGRTARGNYRTGKEVLESLKDRPFIAHLLRLRGLEKLMSQYCTGLQKLVGEDGRLHTQFLIHGTVTGRLSSKGPNLQNIPREDTVGQVLENGDTVKGVFEADEGYCLLQADYSQVELRVLAMLSEDPRLMDIYLQGLDAHTATAAMVYGKLLEEVTKEERGKAKHVNFGIIYGLSLMSLIETFIKEGSNQQAAELFYATHKKKFGRVWEWLSLQEEIVRNKGFQETVFGRRRHHDPPYTDHTWRQAYNFPVQSTANELTFIAITRCDKILRELKLPVFPTITVHDNIVWNVRLDALWEVSAIVKEVMEGIKFDFMKDIPIKVDMEAGLRWAPLKKLDVDNRLIIAA